MLHLRSQQQFEEKQQIANDAKCAREVIIEEQAALRVPRPILR